MIGDLFAGVVVVVSLGVFMIPVTLGLIWLAEAAEDAILLRMDRRKGL